MAFGLSFKDLQGEFHNLPEGKYHAKLITYTRKRLTNIPVLDLTYQVIDDELYNGHKISRLIWEKKRENQSKEDMEVEGFSYKQLMQAAKAARLSENATFNTIDEMLEQCINVPVEIVTELQERNGKTYEGVKFINPLDTGVPVPAVIPAAAAVPAPAAPVIPEDIAKDFEEVTPNGDELPF